MGTSMPAILPYSGNYTFTDPKSAEACRRWYAKNRDSEHMKAGRRERYQNNKEAQNALSKAYKEKHKERLGFMQHKYRARKHGVLSTATYEEWVALCDHYQNRCLCCGEQKPLTVDHVIALVLGGPHTIDNLQPLCKECHMKKNVRMTDYRPAGTVTFNLKIGQ